MSEVAPAHPTFSFLNPSEVRVVSPGCLLCPCFGGDRTCLFHRLCSRLSCHRLSLPSQAAEPAARTPIPRSDGNPSFSLVELVFPYYRMSFFEVLDPRLDCVLQEYTGHRWVHSSSQRRPPHPGDINMLTCLYRLDACLFNANPEKSRYVLIACIGADGDESCNRPWSLWWGNGIVGKKGGGAFVLQVQEDNFL